MKRAIILTIIAAGAAFAASDLSSFTGVWHASCQVGMHLAPNGDHGEQIHVEHFRIVREAGPGKLEVLEFAKKHLYGLDLDPDFRFDVPGPFTNFVIGPRRLTFVRTGDSVFQSGNLSLKFSATSDGVQMYLPVRELKGYDCMFMTDNLAFDRESIDILPSFDCRQARQPREQAICASEALSMLDRYLATAFQAAQVRVFNQAATEPEKTQAVRKLKAEQTDWWAHRLSSCQSADCVEPLYRQRIQTLESIATR